VSNVGKPGGCILAAHPEGTKAAWTSSQLKRFRQGLPAEYFKLNKGEPQKMLKRISTLILSTGMCLALAGPVSLAFQDQSQSQDKASGDKMESHDKMDSHDKMSADKMESHDKMSKDKDKMSKDKMDKEEKMDKMDHQSN
jgi:pentapeptide MXKDX repeat protein